MGDKNKKCQFGLSIFLMYCNLFLSFVLLSLTIILSLYFLLMPLWTFEIWPPIPFIYYPADSPSWTGDSSSCTCSSVSVASRPPSTPTRSATACAASGPSACDPGSSRSLPESNQKYLLQLLLPFVPFPLTRQLFETQVLSQVHD